MCTRNLCACGRVLAGMCVRARELTCRAVEGNRHGLFEARATLPGEHSPHCSSLLRNDGTNDMLRRRRSPRDALGKMSVTEASATADSVAALIAKSDCDARCVPVPASWCQM